MKKLANPLLLEIAILSVGAILTTITSIGLSFRDVAIVSLCFFFINVLSFMIAQCGVDEEAKKSGILILASFGCKFVGELIFALVWFLFLKKIGAMSLLLFFLIYLAFTMFWVISTLKSLKTKQQ